MKLDKELYTKHAKRLQAILNEKSTFAPYIARPDFSKVIEVSLNTLAAVERILTKVELPADLSSKALTKEFNKLGKNSFKIDEKYKYGDEGDLIDNINYLFTYCNNIYKVNLDDLVEGKKVAPANPNINLKGKTEVDEIPEGMAGAGFAGAAGMGMGMTVYDNPFIMGKAFAKVKQDIASGTLYTYKTKPRIIPIIKIISIVMMCITVVALIIGAVFAFKSAPLAIQSLDGSQTATLRLAISAGVFYILLALFGVYPIYMSIRDVVSKNENSKYYYNWSWILMFILLVIIIVLIDLRNTWLINSWCKVIETETSDAYKSHYMWKIMFIVILSCSFLALIPMIIGAVYNPKQNEELLNAKVKEYADQIVAASGFGPGVGAPANGTPTDHQKPVDVKKADPKHKKDSKDSAKHKK